MTLDSWLWGDESTQTRAQKSRNFIKSAPWLSDSFLAIFRVSVAFFWIANEVDLTLSSTLEEFI